MSVLSEQLARIETWQSSDWAFVVSCVAVLVALFAAVFSLLNTGRIVRAQIASADRRSWIDAICDDLALFLRHSAARQRQLQSGLPSAEVLAEAEAARKEMHLLSLRMQLKLDPAAADHREFLRMVEELRTRLPTEDDLPDRIVLAGQNLFKKTARV